MKKIKRNPKLSKNAILDEAKKSFSQKGYRGTTLGDLVTSFGVTKPSIYYYFKNKKEILAELHTKAFDHLISGLRDILLSSDPLKEKFRNILKNHASVVANNAELVKIFFQDEIEIPKELRATIRKRRNDYTDDIIALYREGIHEGIFKEMDARIAVYLLLGSCNWICRWYSKKKKFDPDYVVDCLMQILCFDYEAGRAKQTSNKEIEMKTVR